MKKFDVIIVGAGPGGLRCAEILANSDLKILLVEKNEIIGPKVCAGGLTNKCVDYFGIPDNLLDHKYKKIKLHIPSKSIFVESDNFFVYTIDRKNLGQWQLNKIKNFENVTIKTKARVIRITSNYIIVNNEEKLEYKFLIGADGSNSIVRKYLGLGINNLGITIQYIIPTDKYKNLELFFDSKLFHSWYAWIFPHKDYVAIGCGCNPNHLSIKKLKDNFRKWLQGNNVDITIAKIESHPINYDYKGLKFDNVFLVGDAAGLASNFTGEGIYQAFISGEEVAKMILDKDYSSEKMEKILRTKKIHNLVLNTLIISGIFRPIVLGFISLILRNKKIANWVINTIL